MKDDILSSSGNRSNYTADEIDRARKMQKKSGGTLLDNLAKLTGRGMPSATSMADLTSMYRKANQELSSLAEADIKRQKEAEAKNEAVKQQLMENQQKLNQALDNYTNSLKEDFGIESQPDNSWMKDFGLDAGSYGTGSTGVSGAGSSSNLGAIDVNCMVVASVPC